LWLPYNGKQNQIRVDRERYMKHVVTYLNDSNEPIMFNQSILGNYNLDTFFGDFTTEISPHVESHMQSEILHCTQIVELDCNIVGRKDTNPNVQTNLVVKTNYDVHTNLDVKTNLDVETNSKVNIDMWTLFFDGSKSNEGAGVGCILKDPKGKKNLIACRLEFQCTNNTC
jgi:hypothetical protein